MALGTGFVIIATAIIVWTVWALGRAGRALGDPPLETRRLQWRFTAMAVVWASVALVVAAAGLLRRWDSKPPPLVLLLAAVLIGGVLLARSVTGDRLARGLSLGGLVGIQAFRLPLELLMHQAAEQGVMPVQMSYSGWNFDIVTGVSAAVLAVWLRLGRPSRVVVLAWNILGLALLANIVTIAVLSTPVFAAFGSSADRLNTFVTYPPYILLPVVMVLAAWTGHLVIFRALAASSLPRLTPRRASAPDPR